MFKSICLEGIDGCGKSTQIKMLCESNLRAGYCWLRWKPFILRPLYTMINLKNGRDKRGESITLAKKYENNSTTKKRIFGNLYVQKAWYMVSLLDYFLVTGWKVWKARRNNDLLIFDRYFFDFVVDQGINFKWTIDRFLNEIKKLGHIFSMPDLTVLLDITPEEAFSRKNDIPNMEYLNIRYEIYHAIAEEFSWVVIDATLPKEEICGQLIHMLGSLQNNSK